MFFKIDEKEALLAFSLAFEYLRPLHGDKEIYLDRCQFYLGLLKASKVTLVITLIVCLIAGTILYPFLKDYFIGIYIFITLFNLLLTLYYEKRFVVDKEGFRQALEVKRAMDKKSRTRLIWKYNRPLVLLIIAHFLILMALGLHFNGFLF
ncbi:MAG TPA: hypothetical protein PKA53_03090 [Sphingobacterium sp.]|nr:hypothetical protein [Sphingobacterium sp.]